VQLSAGFFAGLLQIIIINIVLSGDNAVVIGLAANPLPARQRRLAIVLGGAAAVVLRVALTSVAALLLRVWAVQAIGGLLLLWIAFKLLEQQEEASESGRASTDLRSAVGTILLADLIMSLDNVLGVAAASGGDLVLLILGLIISMAIVMLGGGVFAELIDKLWWLAYVGAAVIAWTGIEMTLSDDLVEGMASGLVGEPARLVISAVVTIAVVSVAHVTHRRPARHGPGRASAPQS
jgi:YjbE family integral membrane protein